MSKELSRRSVLKLAGTATVAGLGAGILAPQEANAAGARRRSPKSNSGMNIKDAILDFGKGDDRVTIKCSLTEMTASLNVNDFSVEVVITNLVTGEVARAAQPPTVVR